MDKASWARVKDVLGDALEQAPADREAFVRQRCTDPDELDQLLSMLSSYSDASSAFDLPPLTADGLDDALELEPGSRIGRYVILESIGRGGMGQVFLGNDPQLRRRVALKCLIGSAPHDPSRRQILREARAAACITHPNVATIHDVIEQNDRAFIVMEYVDGESLAARLKRERLPVDRLVAIGRELAAALAAAHAKGVIHRDLKPANVQLTRDGSVKVLDFGIANRAVTISTASTPSSLDTRPTASAAAFGQPGTPPYMAPEQLVGEAATEQSDVFSLGVVLFEMATGRRPFAGSRPAQIAAAQAEGAPRADAVDPQVPPALADVIATALQTDPSRRYASADVVGAALDTIRPPTADRRTPRERILRVAVVAVAAAAALALGLIAIGFVTTIGFNTTFGRDGLNARFGAESWRSYAVWGLLAVFPNAILMLAAAAAMIAARFVSRVLDVFAPYARLRRSVASAVRALGLSDPATLAQALAVVGLGFMVWMFWFHAGLIRALTSHFDVSPIDRLLPMTESASERNYYFVQFDVAIVVLLFGVARVLQLRTATRSNGGYGAVATLIAVISLMVLMNEWPYRIFSHRDFERVALAGARCYITGESGDEFLVLCPGSDPPRNRVVRRDDPALARTGIVENVFRGIPATQVER